MKHYLSFISWLINRVWRAIISGPARLFAWYKHCLKYDTFLATLGFVVGWAVLLFAGAVVSATNENGQFVVRSDDVWPFMIALFVPPAVFIAACVSIQYDRYCSELKRTMDTLKGRHDA
jgi:hypothetical protein